MLMPRVQTLIQLTDDLVALLDQRAARERRSRSDLVREAIERFVEDDRQAEISRRIVEGYTRIPQDDDDFDYTDSAKRVIAAEPW